MDVIVIYNGLGNQMSQYSFYLQKKKINKSTYVISICKTHNNFELKNVFNIELKKAFINRLLYVLFRILSFNKFKIFIRPLQFFFKSLGCKVVSENFDYIFKEKFLLPSKGITFYYGGWHSEKYFLDVEKDIFNAFTFIQPDDLLNLSNIITSSNSVSVHVRRGDYLDVNNIALYGGICDKSYYNRAIDHIKTKFNNLHFFIFSDDIEWAKKNFNIETATFITNNIKKDSWKDMYLMSLCKNNITANSTFSWWGAWLNTNPDKIIICPGKYLNTDFATNIYPESWIKIIN